MPDPRLLVHAGARLHPDLADAVEMDPGPALEDVDHLEVEDVAVEVALALARPGRGDHVCPDLAAGGLDHAEVAVLEVRPQPLVPRRVARVGDVEPPLREAGVDSDRRMTRRVAVTHAPAPAF